MVLSGSSSRLGSRLKTLMEGAEQKVKDESIDDTLMDLANYCIMELVERKMGNEC